MANNNSVTAVASLTGLTLSNGWKVVDEVRRGENCTGGTFSHCYRVVNGNRDGFLKAFDFSSAMSAADIIARIKDLTSAYQYERTILEICREARLSKVVVAIDPGDVQVPGFDGVNGRVFYLIFELADGDIRGQV